MPSFPTFTPSTAIFPALTRVTEVSLACQSSIVPVEDTPVVPPRFISKEFIVVVPPLAEPMFISEVEEAAPPVPKFTVFVVADAVALFE